MRKANTIKGKKKVVRKGKAAKKRFHIGKPTRRVSGIQRLEKLTEKYVAEGMSLGRLDQRRLGGYITGASRLLRRNVPSNSPRRQTWGDFTRPEGQAFLMMTRDDVLPAAVRQGHKRIGAALASSPKTPTSSVGSTNHLSLIPFR